MTKQNAIQELLGMSVFFEAQSERYKSWGNVKVIQAVVKVEDFGYAITPLNFDLSKLKEGDILFHETDKSLYQKLFSTRKKAQVILLTQQEFALQVSEEIPAILDDQAQLLGVSIRIAKTESEVCKALKGRYAAILGNGNSICIGQNLEDAFVVAQLLEKTSKVFIQAKVLGGAKPINKIEAWFMQQYYLLKYSKEAEKNV